MKKLKFMALAVVLVLALIGGAYAAWEEELEIGGTVETGEMKVEFIDYEIDPDSDDVADIDVEKSDCNQEITVTIENAYPGFGFALEVWYENKGSIPVKGSLKETGDRAETPYLIGTSIQPSLELDPGEDERFYHNTAVAYAGEDIPEQDHTYEYTIYLDFQQFNMHED